MSTDPIPACGKGFVRGLALAAVLAVSGCGVNFGAAHHASAQPGDIKPVGDSSALSTPTMAAPDLPELFGLPKSIAFAADFADLRAGLDGRVGVAVMPVGGGEMTQLGDWTTGIAWSTIKVPLALAALRHDPDGMRATAEAAITFSDNDAAQELWTSLGNGSQAADAVEAVLREAGDATTDVAARHTKLAALESDDLLAFGATDWSLSDQVHFASRLPCLPRANSVVSLMSEITPSQSWGLGRLIGAEFKGGWGPDDDTGKYTVRQFGLVPTLNGPVAVALAVEPTSGSFDDATDMMDKLALLVGDHLPDLRGGLCSH
ncbi:serine hydrolase [Nocardia yunnanensis]|uniref:serine hydrolase n=1 Tax=Nocardia yunnanensis TaxID=2382165 RepID=UPI0013C3F13F|nr:serine hydrolase [Nocardia yunnanensis]